MADDYVQKGGRPGGDFNNTGIEEKFEWQLVPVQLRFKNNFVNKLRITDTRFIVRKGEKVVERPQNVKAKITKKYKKEEEADTRQPSFLSTNQNAAEARHLARDSARNECPLEESLRCARTEGEENKGGEEPRLRRLPRGEARAADTERPDPGKRAACARARVPPRAVPPLAAPWREARDWPCKWPRTPSKKNKKKLR